MVDEIILGLEATAQGWNRKPDAVRLGWQMSAAALEQVGWIVSMVPSPRSFWLRQ
ncbi:MAG: hypothetical protein M3300_13110 [Actinomycetota bacterium]|nr:hypothetical protein [Actinomycetota bacterium]